MSNWSEGYVSDVAYTYGYFPELNPLRVRLALLYSGLDAPRVSTACELGYGQGISINIHAAASAVQWHGTDFNPAQARFAQDLAATSGAGLQLQDTAFAEYCAGNDLPSFDYIGLHGIWSWVSDANRAAIIDFIRRKLKPGGVVYVGYNTMPGWATGAPLRKLLSDHHDSMAAPGEAQASRVNAALAFVEKLMSANPGYLSANPDVARKFEALKTQDRNYLAHEYFNRNWHPMYFSDAAAWFSQAKLGYACSAQFLDHIDMLNLTAQQQTMVVQIPDPILRETARDFMVNRQFRKDYWVKGLRRLAPYEQSEALRQQRVVLVAPRSEIKLLINGVTGEASLNEAIYGPLLDNLADHAAKSLGQIEQALAPRGIGFAQLMQAVMVLCGQGKLEPAQDEATIAQARPRTERLNLHLIHKARGSADISNLASPVTGGAVPVTRSGQLLALATLQGHQDPAACARYVLDLLPAHAASKDGKAKAADTEQLALLTQQAREFFDKQRPVLRALQVI